MTADATAMSDAVNDAKLGIDAERIASAVEYWNDRNRGIDTPERSVNKPKGFDDIFDELMRDQVLGALHEEALEIQDRKVKSVISTDGGEKLARAIGYFD